MNLKHAKALRSALLGQGVDPAEVSYRDKSLARIPVTLRPTCGRGYYQTLKRAIKRSKR